MENDTGIHKIKVCHCTSAHPYNDIRIFLKQCCSLASKGMDAILVSPGAPVKSLNNVTLLSVKPAGSRLKRMTRTVWEVYKKSLSTDSHIYHFHDPELIPIGLLLKLKGKKVIYDVHEDLPRQIYNKEWIYLPLRKIVSRLVEKIEIFASQRFDGIVAATPHISKRFSGYGCRSVVNVNNYPLKDELYTGQSRWENKQPVVCYAGIISDIRGIYEMVAAAGKAATGLILAGKFATDQQRIKAMGIDGWNLVDELGQVERDTVRNVLSKSMAGLVLFHPIPNHIEAQPNKMFEYMSAGIPVIASDFPLWREIVEGNSCGICVNPLDVQAISAAIRWIVEHPDEARKMGENGRRAVETKYNWEAEFKKLLVLYGDLA